MEKYIINIHSFVDLITNSSSEIFVCANEKTVESVKLIINNILEMGGSKLRADDLFAFELEEDEESSDYPRVSLIVKNKDKHSERGKIAARLLSDLTGLFSIEASYDS